MGNLLGLFELWILKYILSCENKVFQSFNPLQKTLKPKTQGFCSCTDGQIKNCANCQGQNLNFLPVQQCHIYFTSVKGTALN